ncbi:type I-G CRISPR-associated RAMP protein Csb1/Cas7g [Micromonospora polyrhachis]|nr:type I-U CRISPR-associated RAMP protein Csb1/Cas7u [Micromonospora polyrhachis]
MSGLVDRLISAVGADRRESGIGFNAVYQPVGGQGGKIMPPTLPVPDDVKRAAQRDGRSLRPYLFEERLIDGERRDTVVLDQVPSQANRVEEALLAARDTGRLDLPMFELLMKDEGIRLTSLDFPHRYADAYLRDSEVAGVRFDSSEVGQALRLASVNDVRPLYRREPYSLIFGAWDSHRKGRWPKFARLYSSMMFGTEWLTGERRAGRFDPMNITGAIDDKAKAEGNWRFLPEGTKAKGGKLSEIGHGHIAPNASHGGVTVREVRRQGWISCAGLERLRFGDASPEAATLARATLAALALAGDRLAFGRPSLWLRSGCDLTKVSETLFFEVVGGAQEPIEASSAEILAAFVELRDRAASAGIVMEADVIEVAPTKQLAEAIRFALRSAAPDAGE